MKIDYRADYYVLGGLFYQVFTGKPPFNEKNYLDLIHSHIAKLPVAPNEIDSQIPKMISKIIIKLLAKDPDKRYQVT